eukprot:PhM_4_TR5536/c0_g1_i1/m.102714
MSCDTLPNNNTFFSTCSSAHMFPVEGSLSEEDLKDRDDCSFKKHLRRVDMYLSSCRIKDQPSTPEMLIFDIAGAFPISVKDYMSRVSKKAMASFGSLVCAMVYLERLASRGHDITTTNVHKTLMVAIRLAAKVWDDTIIHPQDYAFLAGVDHATITFLETEFLRLVGYDLYVTVAEYRRMEWVIGIASEPPPPQQSHEHGQQQHAQQHHEHRGREI